MNKIERSKLIAFAVLLKIVALCGHIPFKPPAKVVRGGLNVADFAVGQMVDHDSPARFVNSVPPPPSPPVKAVPAHSATGSSRRHRR